MHRTDIDIDGVTLFADLEGGMNWMNRRSLLGGLGAAALASPLAARPRRAVAMSLFRHWNLPIGLQIYTLGPEAGRDLDATFAQVAQIGYREIEMPGLLGRKPAEVAAAAGRAGLKISSVHLPLMPMGAGDEVSLASEPARVVDELGTLGASWAVAPILILPADFRPRAGESFQVSISRSIAAAGADIWKRTAQALNEKASALNQLGIKVGYHNHNLEFAPVDKGTGWDILWRETDPALVNFEVDIGWVAAAGLDPLRFLERAGARVKLLHVKDIAAGTQTNNAIDMHPAEVGSGILPWSKILPAAYRAGVRHFFVEQEPPFTIPRIEAAARSYAFLSKLRG